jgi:hypothetical protein
VPQICWRRFSYDKGSSREGVAFGRISLKMSSRAVFDESPLLFAGQEFVVACDRVEQEVLTISARDLCQFQTVRPSRLL